MAVWSIFDFHFPSSAHEEGLQLANAIGADMVECAGYRDYQVIRDVTDRGHLMVNTLWDSVEAANGTLSVYKNDAKIAKATELMGHESPGFLGELLSR